MARYDKVRFGKIRQDLETYGKVRLGKIWHRAGGTAPATPAMAGPKFCEPARKLSARAKINVSRQEPTISCQRDHELKALTAFKWINPIAVSNHFGN